MVPRRREFARRLVPPRDDTGSAMLMTMLVLALLTALASTVALVTIDNLRSSLSAQHAGSALNAADAGVAQAISYMNTTGVHALSCSPSCSGNSWGNKDDPTHVELGGDAGEAYSVWIQPWVDAAGKVHSFPAYKPGIYTITSTGTALGSASRTVEARVTVTTADVPHGIFAKSISGGGNASVTRVSVLSTGCVWQRAHILTPADPLNPANLDAYYGIPVGVHTSNYITESNGTAQYCPSTDKKLIHKSGACSTDYPFDQDKLGGDLTTTGAACKNLPTAFPKYYPKTLTDGVWGSQIQDDAALKKLFNIQDPPLTPEMMDYLRSVAKSQGNYYTNVPSGSITPQGAYAVLFFDLAKGSALGDTVDLTKIVGYDRGTKTNISADDLATCKSDGLTIVIDGGNAKLNSNQTMYASLYLTGPAPYGTITKANGTANFVGTIYAQTLNMVGTLNVYSDSCFVANSSPALFNFDVLSYRELDRGLS